MLKQVSLKAYRFPDDFKNILKVKVKLQIIFDERTFPRSQILFKCFFDLTFDLALLVSNLANTK